MHKSYYNDSKEIIKYYDEAKEASDSFKNTEQYKIISKYIQDKNKICELWCWEWSKLAVFQDEWRELYGFDISEVGIEKAKKQYPNINFIIQDAENIEWYAEFFDCTMSFFVLEHIEKPEIYIDNMINITKKWGLLVFRFPNYGSPLFPAPPTLYKKSAITKFLLIFRRLFSYSIQENFYKNIQPILWNYECDYDAVSEIYMGKFRKYLKNKNLKIIHESSCWENCPKWPLFKLYTPFKLYKYMWPQCFMILEKK